MISRSVKHHTLSYFLFVAALLIASCSRQTDSGQAEEASEKPLSEELRKSNAYPLWELIIGDYNTGIFRGVSFGDSRDKVKITETFEIFEELPEQIGYTHDTRDLETIDVYYHFSEQQMTDRMVVDIFLNGKSSVDQLWQISDWYFSNRFGTPSETTESSKTWVSDEVRLVVENVSSGIDNGLKITLTPAKAEALAIHRAQ